MTRQPRAQSAAAGPLTDVRRGGERFVTRTDWLVSRHSFSFGEHYDPGNVGFGSLLAANEDVLRPGSGFEPHPHRDVAIVTWVLDGALAHEDSTGAAGVLRPGVAQLMRAGSGIVHSERNASPTQPVHYMQMWVAGGGPPGYEYRDVTPVLLDGGLAAILTIRPATTLYAARLVHNACVTLPPAAYAHLQLLRGTVDLDGPEGIATLAAGDAVRITRSDGLRVTAAGDAELLVWAMGDAG